jgi:hypothetical protein
MHYPAKTATLAQRFGDLVVVLLAFNALSSIATAAIPLQPLGDWQSG